jgi:hypothetical protein
MDNIFSNNNLTSIDREIMEFTDELLRRYDNRNSHTFRNREHSTNMNHNRNINSNIHLDESSILYALMSEYNLNIREYNSNMRLFLNHLDRVHEREPRYNNRQREPYVRTPYVDHVRHNARTTNHTTNANTRTPNINTTNRTTNARPYATSQLLSYVLYPNTQSLFSDVIVHPTENEIVNATELITYNNTVEYNNNTCPITLEEFLQGERICQIKHCGHIFREEALRNWFRRNVRCPVCRYDIRNYVNTNRNTDNSNNDLLGNTRTNILGRQYDTESDREDSENDEIIEPNDNTTTMPPIPDTLSRNLTNILVDYINNHVGPSMADMSGGFTHTFDLPIFYYSDNSGYYFDSSNNSNIV